MILLLATLCAPVSGDERAATLHVRWKGAPPAAERVSLLPVDVVLPPELSRQQAIARWTHGVDAGGHTWSALPPGTFRIVVRGELPREVGEVVLAPGEERTLELALPPAERVAEAPVLRVSLAGADVLRDGTATVWSERGPRTLPPPSPPTADGVQLTLTGGCIAGGTFVLASRSHIAAIALDGVCAESIALKPLPRATLTARFTVPAGVKPPRFGAVRLAGCDAAVTMFPFTIDGGRAEVPLPAGCRAVSVHLDDFTPVLLTPRVLAAGESHDAGTIALRPGAAAVLRIRSAHDARPLAGVRVSALRASDLVSMREQVTEDGALAAGITDAAGWVRLTGLPDEKFVLVLRAPARRHPQISEPYRIEPSDEAVLDDVALEPPSNVHVTLSLDEALAQAVQVKRVELLPEGHNHWPARVPLAGTLTATGAVIEDVPPGTWSVRAIGRLTNGFSSELGKAAVETAEGADAFVTLTVVDRVFRGRVTRGGDAVTGTINLKPAERGNDGHHAVATLAHDGTFEVLLGRGGDYTATVQESSGTMTKLNRYIAFHSPDEEVAIELPAGRIEGRVVDAAGAPVAGAGVAATQQLAGEPAGVTGASSGKDGRFVLESISPGMWELIARTPDGKSEPVTVSFDTRDVGGITLLLDPTRTISIRVVDVTGTPVRAIVDVELPPRVGERSRGDIRMTNAKGIAEFQMSRSDQVHPTNVIIATPDRRLSCALLRLDSDHTVTFPASSGEVRLVRDQWAFAVDLHPRVVASSGCSIPFLGTRTERDPRGGVAKVMLPIPPGSWRYVEARGNEQLAILLTGQAEKLTPIETFTVDAERVTRVVLDNQ